MPEALTDPKFYGPEAWRVKVQKHLKAQFEPTVARGPVFKIAPMLTSNTLLKNVDLAKEWLSTARHAASVEMELGGLYLAARYGGDANTA